MLDEAAERLGSAARPHHPRATVGRDRDHPSEPRPANDAPLPSQARCLPAEAERRRPPPARRRAGPGQPDFAAVNRAALPHLQALCAPWLPGGRRVGAEWFCGNLKGEPGASCKVNLRSGRWCDFATGEKGGDPVSLAAAIHRLTQAEAARRLGRMLGIATEAGRHG